METFVAAGIVIIPIIAGRVRVFPVKSVRIVKAETKTVFPSRRRQLTHWIPLEWSGITDVVTTRLGWIHRETVVMLCRNDDVLHPCTFDHSNPLFRVKLNRIKNGDHLLGYSE